MQPHTRFVEVFPGIAAQRAIGRKMAGRKMALGSGHRLPFFCHPFFCHSPGNGDTSSIQAMLAAHPQAGV
jgi:hypothetical protein